MVVADSKSSRGVSSGNRGTVTESKNPSDILAAKLFHHRVSGRFRILEMHSDGAIAPGILQLMAAIRNVNELYAKFKRGFFKTARLVAQLASEEQQSFGWSGHAGWVSTPESDEAVGSGQNIFHLRLRGADGNQLVARRFGAAIPRLAEIRDGGFSARW